MDTTAASAEPLASRLWAALPDALLALLFLAIAWSGWQATPITGAWFGFGGQPLDLNHPAIIAIVAIEVGFLFPQLTLTDLATRIRKRPPWWLIPPIAVGVLLLAPGGMEFFRLLLSNQPLLVVPAMWSVFHRARQLWVLPGTPALQRMRVRALVNGRANVGGLLVVLMLAASIARTSGWLDQHSLSSQDLQAAIAAALYFLATAFDAWRVGGPAFARSPRPLLWFDMIGVRDTETPI